MSDTEQIDPEQEATRPENVDENGEVHEPTEPDTNGDEPIVDDDPDQDEAEATAEYERRQELAAARQAEEQAAQAAQADAEKLMKSLNKSADNYVKRLKDLLGPELEGWQPCPLCAEGLPGFRVPVMPAPEYVAAVKIAIGEDPDPPLKDDPYSRQCDSCGGFGVTKTNSHVTGQTSATCLDCKGRGWIAVGSERDTYASGAPNGSPVVESPVAEGFPPPPLITETPRTPAEEELRALGAIVVWPPKPPDPATLIGG